MSERWRLGPRRWDWLRSLHCLIAGHEWTMNRTGTQAACHRCWIIEERIPRVPGEPTSARRDGGRPMTRLDIRRRRDMQSRCSHRMVLDETNHPWWRFVCTVCGLRSRSC